MPLTLIFMIHDQITARQLSSARRDDRRGGPRRACPAELVIAWHGDMSATARYPIVDMNDGGFRIRSALPLITGMTGTAITLLPEGRPIGHPVMVVWRRRNPCEPGKDDGYDVGLRRF
jgi:hypothetical protein